MHAGPNIERDGLVFGYDTGYPVVSGNSDTYRFNLGEPTTNALNGDIIGTGNGASLGSDAFGDYIQLADITSSYSRLQLPNITVNSNDTYTWTFELYSDETINRSGNTYYFDTNEYSDQFPASNDLSRLSSTLTYTDPMPAGKWVPYKLRVTMKDNLTGAYAYDFFNFTYPTFQNKKIYYRNMQVEFKDHQTPYVGQGGVRSASGSLLDLKGNTDIDLSNVSFDSNAQMTFDGTDDYIEVADGNSLDLTTTMSFEFIVKADSSQSNLYPRLIDKSVYLVHLSQTSPFTIAQNITTSEGLRQTAVGSAFAANEWTHIVSNYDGQYGKIYVNGVLVKTSDFSSVLACNTNNTSLKFGGNGTSDRVFNGKIATARIYNKVLSASEVQQNYLAYKNRFNL